jgi:formate dehydrogenase maturation protein FdhE
VSESPAAARNTSFAAIALLRCRERLARLLEAVSEPRRSEFARAIAQNEHLDEQQLKQILAQVMRRERATTRESSAQVLGSAIARAPRVVRIWLARETEP